MDEKVIDVDFTEIDDRDFFSIDEAAKKIGVDVNRIIFYCNKFEDILKINSIGQFKIFNKDDIRNLKTIKELNIDQNMSISETRKYLSQHTTAIVVRKDTELDMSIFNFFSNIINTQNEKIDKMLEFQTKQMKFITQVYNEIAIDSNEKSKVLNKLLDGQTTQRHQIEKMQSDIIATVDDVVSEKLDNLSNSLTDFKSQLDERELDYHRKNLEEIDKLRKGMEDRERQYKKELEEQKNKSWLSKLFSK